MSFFKKFFKSMSKPKSKYVYILDNGHGGLINGVYQTSGKRSPKFEDGTVLYEGVFNRKVVDKIIAKLLVKNIKYIKLVNTEEDTSLTQRVSDANTAHKKSKNTILISIHGNAHGNGVDFTSANGIDSFYFEKDSYTSSTGKKLAAAVQPLLIEKTGRRDRGIKGRNFKILRETSMPAVLLENGFMTNKEEATLMLTDEYQEKIADAVVEFIMKIEKGEVI